MANLLRGVMGRVHQPAYTGENRCLPCTLVNLVLAALASIVMGAIFPLLGLIVASGSVALIYLRGYLVPGTPTLTKRYFPDGVLRWFEKTSQTELDTSLDAEAQLLALGAIEPHNEDVVLAESFASDWSSEIKAARARPEDRLAPIVESDADDLVIEGQTNMCLVMEKGREVARWPSREALIADLAAIPLLRTRTENWEALTDAEQSHLLTGLRIFLEECPSCERSLVFREETVESCCRIATVVTYDCPRCVSRLVEVEA